MDYLVDATPEECLDAATAYLVRRGYSIETRVGNTATFTRAPELGCEAQIGIALAIAISLGTAAVISGALYLMGISSGRQRWLPPRSQPARPASRLEGPPQELSKRSRSGLMNTSALALYPRNSLSWRWWYGAEPRSSEPWWRQFWG